MHHLVHCDAGDAEPTAILAELLEAESYAESSAADGQHGQQAALWAVGGCLIHLKSLLADRCHLCQQAATCATSAMGYTWCGSTVWAQANPLITSSMVVLSKGCRF